MLLSSSPWQALLYMAVLLLGFLVQDTNALFSTETSDVFKMMTSKPDYGGSCDPYITAAKKDKTKPNPEDAIGEVLDLCKAAVKALNDAMTDADPKKVVKGSSYKQNRQRILLLAEKFWGAEFNKATLQHTSDTSKTNLKNARDKYNQILTYINKKPKDYRLACGDTWVKTVTELETKFTTRSGKEYDKGTLIKDIREFGNPYGKTGFEPRDYVWYDRSATGDNVPGAYFTQDKWSKKGPCVGGIEVGNGQDNVFFQAEEMDSREIIYICQHVWELKAGANVIKSLKPFTKDGAIPTDGNTDEENKERKVEKFMTPGGVLLHEMTHQLLDAKDGDAAGNGFGYGFEECVKGQKYPDNALKNPDNYALFGISMYLNKYDWSTGFARKLSAMPGE